MNYHFEEISRSIFPRSILTQSIIRITINDVNYDITFLFDIPNKQVHITNLMTSMKKVFGIGENAKTVTNFLQYQDTVRFIDLLSFNKYGHLHYTYNKGKNNLYGINEFKPELMESYMIDKQFIRKSKFIANKDILDKNTEIIFDADTSKAPKGKIGDYELIEPIFTYTLPDYKIISKDLKEFIGELLNDETESTDKPQTETPIQCSHMSNPQISDYKQQLKQQIENELQVFKTKIFNMIDEL